MKYVRQLTNRITMYTVVGLALTLIWLAAFIAGLSGAITIKPLDLTVFTLVIAVVSVVAGQLGAWLVGTKQHLASPLISSTIVALTFTPHSGRDGLIIAVCLGLLIASSKYLLAWRGRHIFNPVVAAMLVAHYSQIASPSWWVTTPVLFPFILAGGFITLAKTRKLQMAGIFLLIAVSSTFVRQLGFDETALSALKISLMSWPSLFLAGFMLSEPLTMPPRRWQQNIYASLIGIGSIFFYLPTVLAAGNVGAFLLGQKRGLRLKLASKRHLAGDIHEFIFDAGSAVHFQAGQFIELSLPNLQADTRGSRRMFSIASAPGSNKLRLVMRLPQPMSKFKQRLNELQVDDEVAATFVGGDFVLPKDTSNPILMIAGGIGITPFISQLLNQAQTGKKRDVTLVYCVKTKTDAVYTDWLANQQINLQIVEGASLPDFSDYVNHEAFVSGPPGLVDVVTTKLKNSGNHHIHTDYFSGY